MKGRRAHDLASLTAAGVALLAATFAEAAGPLATAGGLAALVVGYGRGRGWSLSRALERPRLFGFLAALYLPFLLFDLVLLSRGDPVIPLVRLVIFLLAAEVVAGDPARAHRPVLFGLLMIIATAAETTEIWFAFPLAAFTLAALRARMDATLSEARPVASPPPARGAPALAAGTMACGLVLFFLVPHLGTGWGRHPASRGGEAALGTGLTDAVRLGAVGRVKKRTTIAFRARLDRRDLDPESVYWRGRSYSHWTGDGWARDDEGALIRRLNLPAGQLRAVPLPEPPLPASLVAEIELVRPNIDVLLVPGRPVWIRAERNAAIQAWPDGTLRADRGAAPRRYEVAVSLERPRLGRNTGAGAREAARPIYLQTGPLDRTTRRWARGAAPGSTDPLAIAQALAADLEARPYSLDTRQIDPHRPVSSFLEGAPAHCEYFASAMVLGLRLHGVPSRVVGGYAGAEKVPFSSDLIVRDSRAHMWVEAYIPEYGWVPFDPTPPAGREVLGGTLLRLRAAWDRTAMAWDSWIIGLDLGDQLDLALGLRGALLHAANALTGPGLPWLASGILLFALVVGTLWLARRMATRRASEAGLPRHYRRFLRLAARAGFRPAESETATEFAARAAPTLGDEDAVRLLSRLYERERFGGRPPTPNELSRASAALASLRHRPAS